jgi:hypothetical protein
MNQWGARSAVHAKLAIHRGGRNGARVEDDGGVLVITTPYSGHDGVSDVQIISLSFSRSCFSLHIAATSGGTTGEVWGLIGGP